MTPNELSTLIMQIPVQLMEFSDDPSVQMKLLFPLCDYHVTLVETSAPLGAAENTAMKATAALCRRAAISCLCKSASTWKADNWDEVVKVKQKISNFLNREIMSAIDDNNIDTANSLRELRIKTLEILTNAAGELPHLRTIERNTPLPALLIAQQLYADASRTEEIIRRSNPAHSAFMPVKMEVLSS